MTLDGVTMSIDFGQTADRIESRNILARIPGAAHPDETVLYGAHWDAYGRATPVGTTTSITAPSTMRRAWPG